MDDKFRQSLRSYAVAVDLAGTASGHAKSTYESKADGFLGQMVRWLQEHLASAFDVTHQGKTRKLIEWVKGKVTTTGTQANVRDIVNTVGSVCLATNFADQAPDYSEGGRLYAGCVVGGGRRGGSMNDVVLRSLTAPTCQLLNREISKYSMAVQQVVRCSAAFISGIRIRSRV